MRLRAWAPGVLAGFACALAWTGARAAEETLVDTVAGYQINRVNEPANAYPCRMVRGYADPKDNNAANALAFAQLDGLFIVSLVYERWKWEAGKLYKARFSVDNKLIDADAQWLGNGTNLAIKVPVSHLPKFNAGKKIILGFKNGTADFDLTGFRPAYEATVRCNRDAAAAKSAAKVPEKAAEAKPIGSGIAAAPPPPAAVPAPPSARQPTPPPAPVAAPAGPLPSEDRAVAYLFALYNRWAFDACDMRTTAKQRASLEAKAAALKPEMTAIEPDLQKQAQGDPNRCPPASVIEAQLQLLIDKTPEDFVAKMDERTRKEFQGIVRPILDRLKPAAPPTPATVTEQKPLPSERRIGAYLIGLTLKDLVQRCDFATTAKQRTGLDAKIEALRPEMAEIEATIREAAEKPVCPGPDNSTDSETDIVAALTTYVESSPEDFAVAWDAKRDGIVMRRVRTIVEKVRPSPPVPSQARMSAYLWGLVLQDKIAQCDIATTAKQRAGLDAKVASLKQEMAAVEAALRDQIKGQIQGCPTGDEFADLGASLALFIEAQPEDFAAEMDKRSAARRTAAAASEERKDAPAPAAPTTEPKAAICKDTIFPQTAAELAAGLGEHLKPLGVQDLVEKPSAGTDRRTYQTSGADIELDVLEKDGRITGFFLTQRGESSKKEWDIALATTAYIVATFTKEPEDKVAEDVKAKLGDVSATSPRTEKFGTAGVFYVRENGAHVTLVIDNAGAATAECGR